MRENTEQKKLRIWTLFTQWLLHDFLVVLSTYGTPILCARSMTVSGISTPDFLKIPIIFSKTLSLFHPSLLEFLQTWGTVFFRIVLCCSISSCFCKFCFLISKPWLWNIVLSDSSSSILLHCLFSSFVNCDSVCFRNFLNKFPHIYF